MEFVLYVITTLSSGKVTYLKFADLDELWIFGIHDFFIWHHLVFQKHDARCHFLKFKIWIVQTLSNGVMTQVRFVDLDELYNFCTDDFFIWHRLGFKNLTLRCNYLKFKILSYSNFATSNDSRPKMIEHDFRKIQEKIIKFGVSTREKD